MHAPKPVRLAIIAFLLAVQPAAAVESRIAGVANPEDLAPLGDGWVIASSMAGGANTQGALLAIDARGGSIRRLYPVAGRAATAATAHCPGEVAAAAFAPHGIALQRGRDGALKLYAVNHGARESVEIFEVENAAPPALRWAGCAILPPGVTANAVAALADGTIFVSNMGKPLDGSPAASMMGGDVLVWTAAAGWRAVPDSRIAGPNGLLASEDGRRLYIASWIGGEIVELSLRDGHAARRVLKAGMLPDNLRWGRNGAILAAGHRTSVEKVIACYTGKAPCSEVASSISEIDPVSFTVRCTRPVDLPIATAAVEVGDEIWLGAARGDAILRLPGSALTPPACD